MCCCDCPRILYRNDFFKEVRMRTTCTTCQEVRFLAHSLHVFLCLGCARTVHCAAGLSHDLATNVLVFIRVKNIRPWRRSTAGSMSTRQIDDCPVKVVSLLWQDLDERFFNNRQDSIKKMKCTKCTYTFIPSTGASNWNFYCHGNSIHSCNSPRFSSPRRWIDSSRMKPNWIVFNFKQTQNCVFIHLILWIHFLWWTAQWSLDAWAHMDGCYNFAHFHCCPYRFRSHVMNDLKCVSLLLPKNADAVKFKKYKPKKLGW